MTKPLVYIAAPYTHPDPVKNTHDVIKLASSLYEDGKVTPVVPHLSLLWHLIDPHPIGWWYAYDLELLAHCGAVLRRLGPSTGADNEVDAANRARIPVFASIEGLYRAIDNGQFAQLQQAPKGA